MCGGRRRDREASTSAASDVDKGRPLGRTAAVIPWWLSDLVLLWTSSAQATTSSAAEA